MHRGLLLDRLGVKFLGPAPLDLELLRMLTQGETWLCCQVPFQRK